VSSVEFELPAAFRSSVASSVDAPPSRAFLAHLSQTTFARGFFRRELRQVESQHYLRAITEDDVELDASAYTQVDSSTLAYLASLYEKLGSLAVARQLFQFASQQHTDIASPYAVEVERIRRQMAMDDERQRMSQQFSSAAVASAPLDASIDSNAAWMAARSAEPRSVDRIHHSQLSYQEFIDRYVSKREPVVLLGLTDIIFGHDRVSSNPCSSRSSDGQSAAASSSAADDSMAALATSAPSVSSHLSSAAPWTFSSLLPHVGHLNAVSLKYTHAHSTSWARLETRGCKSMTSILQEMTVQRERELDASRRQETKPAASEATTSAAADVTPPPTYYVHDESLVLSVPSLLSSLTLPRYFSNDLFQSLTPGSMFRDSWPSLFVGARGSRSHLHIDTLATHFWMTMCGDAAARKKWILYEPRDLPLLYPNYSNYGSIDPLFDLIPYEAEFVPEDEEESAVASSSISATATSSASSFFSSQHSRYPLFVHARPRIVVLRAGEVLFVPHGTPHYVENLDTTLSFSCNFIAADNIAEFKRDVRLMANIDSNEGMARVAQQLEAKDWQEKVDRRVEEQKRRMRDATNIHSAVTATSSTPSDDAASAAPDDWPQHLPFDIVKLHSDAHSVQPPLPSSSQRATSNAPDRSDAVEIADSLHVDHAKRRKLDHTSWVASHGGHPTTTGTMRTPAATPPPAAPAPHKRQSLKHFF
jgi:hypothetical protein